MPRIPDPARLAAALALVALAPETAAATDTIFTTGSPLVAFRGFITGPFAYLLTILGLIGTVYGLMVGGQFSGFMRAAPVMVIAGAIIISSDLVVSNLFGGRMGFEVPADLALALPGQAATPIAG